MKQINSLNAEFGNYKKQEKDEASLVKFIHASDIHLGHLQYRNDPRSDDFVNAFQEILNLAIVHDADFILLGGDVFASLDILPAKLERIVTILKDFKNLTNGSIPLIAIEGNHDIRKYARGKMVNGGQSWLKFLSSLELLILLEANLAEAPELMFTLYNPETRKGGKIEIKNIMIYGIQFLSDNIIKDYFSKIREVIIKKEGMFNVLLQHFGIEGQMKNVPGLDLKLVIPLKTKVDYLALGHYHKQFIIDDWIYNPGSSEAACALDHSYERGVFLVEIRKNNSFIKKVQSINLNNRKHVWMTLNLSRKYKKKHDFFEYLIQETRLILARSNYNEGSGTNKPILYLKLKGIEPARSCKYKENELCKVICEKLPIVDVRIYKNFKSYLQKLEKFF